MRKGKSGSAKSVSKKKSDDLWNGKRGILNKFPLFLTNFNFFFRIVEGTSPATKSPLDPVLHMTLPQGAIVQDASLPVLTLLRILHAISRHWGTLYPAVNYKSLLPLQVIILHTRNFYGRDIKFENSFNCFLVSQEFVNIKLSAKANRQLQDPLVIMTGNLPSWLNQVALLRYVMVLFSPFDYVF